MSQMEIDRVLAQIRSLSAQIQPAGTPAGAEVRRRPVSEFANIMRSGHRPGEPAAAARRGSSRTPSSAARPASSCPR